MLEPGGLRKPQAYFIKIKVTIQMDVLICSYRDEVEGVRAWVGGAGQEVDCVAAWILVD